MDQILNKDIKISKIEQSAKVIKFSDQDGHKYTLWVKKQDGNNTQAYELFKAMELMVDSIANVSFKQEEKQFVNEKQQAVKYQERTVIGFRETSEVPKVLDYHDNYRKPKVKTTEQEEIKPDWRAINRGKIATNLAQGYLAGGHTIPDLDSSMVELLRTADTLLTLSETFADTEIVKTNEIDTEDIPF